MRFIATLVGLGSVGSAIAWSPWFFVLAILAISWALMDSAHRIHSAVPTGDVVASVRRTLRHMAQIVLEMRRRGVLNSEYNIWFDDVVSFLGRAFGNPTASEFRRNWPPRVGMDEKPYGNDAALAASADHLLRLADKTTDRDIQRDFDISERV